VRKGSFLFDQLTRQPNNLSANQPTKSLFLAKRLMMNKKWYPYLLIIALGVIFFFVKRAQRDHKKTDVTTNDKRTDPASTVNRNRSFDRRISYIEYTGHAKCRMQCRHISQAEVEDIMRQGKINYNKTELDARPCPAYALEGITRDDQRVRIIFGQCDQTTKVITVIDLNTDWSCDCPGDDDKYKNRN